MKKKELKQKRLREQMEAENPNTAFPRLRMSKREFTQFVIANMLKNIEPLDRQYILEHPQPMDYYFTACMFLRNHYVAYFDMQGGRFSDVSHQESDIFRDSYSVELMQEIITPYSTYYGYESGVGAHIWTLRWPYILDAGAPYDIRTDTNSKVYYLWRKYVTEGEECTTRWVYPEDIILWRYLI